MKTLTESLIKEVVKSAKKVATKKVVTPKIKDVKKPSKVATVQAKAVTLDQIKEVIKLGTMTLTTEKKMTDTIVADLGKQNHKRGQRFRSGKR